MRTHHLSLSLLAAGSLLLAGCGNKGPLTLPPKADAPKPAVQQAPAAKPAADISSTPAPASQ